MARLCVRRSRGFFAALFAVVLVVLGSLTGQVSAAEGGTVSAATAPAVASALATMPGTVPGGVPASVPGIALGSAPVFGSGSAPASEFGDLDRLGHAVSLDGLDRFDGSGRGGVLEGPPAHVQAAGGVEAADEAVRTLPVRAPLHTHGGEPHLLVLPWPTAAEPWHVLAAGGPPGLRAPDRVAGPLVRSAPRADRAPPASAGI